MRLTILLAGQNPPALQGDFAPYGEKFMRMFAGADDSFTFEEVEVHAGQTIPDPGQLEGVIVSGSAAGVYDDLEWMRPLGDFIRRAHGSNLPMLGICFGHQMIAHALGGKVIMSPKGWGLGRHVYRASDIPSFFPRGTRELAMAASHRDQVVVPPPGARVFLSSSFTPNAGLIYENGTTISLQPHPEFDVEYAAAIFGLRRSNPLEPEEVEAAIRTLQAPLDNDLVARSLAGFFREAAGRSRAGGASVDKSPGFGEKKHP